MKGQSVYKIPDGKLVKIFLEFDQKKITGIKIFGDFFLHPEDAIDFLENGLVGKKFDEKELVESVQTIVSKKNIELFGLTPLGLSTAILLAKQGGENAGV